MKTPYELKKILFSNLAQLTDEYDRAKRFRSIELVTTIRAKIMYHLTLELQFEMIDKDEYDALVICYNN